MLCLDACLPDPGNVVWVAHNSCIAWCYACHHSFSLYSMIASFTNTVTCTPCAMKCWFAGVSVLGVYLYGPDAAFANASRQMCLMLDGITSGATTPADKLLFISSKSRKLLCKQHSAGTANAAALHVCEFKLGPMLPNFSIMTCRSGDSM